MFFADQCSSLTIIKWSRLSDRIGRKPVLLCGLAGLSVSMMVFGLSHAFWGILLARAIAGVFSANGGVIQSMLGEITDPSNQAQAFTLMPLMSGVGGSVGPFVSRLWVDRERILTPTSSAVC
jgi:MFS family permease